MSRRGPSAAPEPARSFGRKYKEDHRDARRLFYVGMTRAPREVHLLFSGFFHNAKGKLLKHGLSPFALELWNRLKPPTG